MKKVDTSKSEGASSGKDVTEPFTILLMGIDSTAEVLTKNMESIDKSNIVEKLGLRK